MRLRNILLPAFGCMAFTSTLTAQTAVDSSSTDDAFIPRPKVWASIGTGSAFVDNYYVSNMFVGVNTLYNEKHYVATQAHFLWNKADQTQPNEIYRGFKLQGVYGYPVYQSKNIILMPEIGLGVGTYRVNTATLDPENTGDLTLPMYTNERIFNYGIPFAFKVIGLSKYGGISFETYVYISEHTEAGFNLSLELWKLK